MVKSKIKLAYENGEYVARHPLYDCLACRAEDKDRAIIGLVELIDGLRKVREES